MKKPDDSETQITGLISINVCDNGEPVPLKDFAPEHILVLPTRNLVLFPGVALPIQLGRDSSISVANFAKKSGSPIVIACQRNPEVEEPGFEDLYDVGTIARVIDVIELPDGVKTAIVEGRMRARLLSLSDKTTLPGVLAVSLSVEEDQKGKMPEKEFETVLKNIRETASNILQNPQATAFRPINMPALSALKSPSALVNTIATNMHFEVSDKQNLLSESEIDKRAMALLSLLINANEQLDIAHEIMMKAQGQINANQREGYLRQQMDIIRQELNEDPDDEIDELALRGETAGFPESVATRFDKEIRKLRRYNPQSPDYAVQYTYLDTLASLPWSDMSMQTTDFEFAETVLENDHYGLRKIKDRILEQLAVIMHNPEGQAPIICFVGPPGVGKTSLGQSIANALGRDFERVSLGGLHDEAEIRGHRRTYIGAMPGRIIEAMRRVGTINPVILLDEIDKIGADFKGDPAAALLEVLDPAQNYRFHDNYIDVDYDLSKVIFIATANTLSTISKPLHDRIETIEISGYTVEEKLEIAKRHIIPRLLLKNGVSDSLFSIDDDTLIHLITRYTSESGVRQLEKRLESLIRKNLLRRMRNPHGFRRNITSKMLGSMLGPEPYFREKYEGNDFAGVVTGLAWTTVGGEILLVEVAPAPGKGNITMTGNLGDVMKESATLAWEWIKVNSAKLGLDPAVFRKNDILVHFPEGAVPKDGPSAGITIVSAIVSALKGVKVKPRLAMTGEITLRGKVLPVGGIKEKILAAKRAGIIEIIISEDNRKDVEDIEAEYTDGLKFVYVSTIDNVLSEALTDTPAITVYSLNVQEK